MMNRPRPLLEDPGHFRRRAEELRTIADGYGHTGYPQDLLRREADAYDRMATAAELRLFEGLLTKRSRTS